MPRHAEKRRLTYSAEQVFDLVADIERYPEFLPWCLDARIRDRHGDSVHAELLIGFRMIRERYSSLVTFARPHGIDVTYTHGPFEHLDNHWRFVPDGPGACLVEFYVEFEFRSRLLRAVMNPLFHEAVHRMVAAFETRARRIYGPPAAGARMKVAEPTVP